MGVVLELSTWKTIINNIVNCTTVIKKLKFRGKEVLSKGIHTEFIWNVFSQNYDLKIRIQ